MSTELMKSSYGRSVECEKSLTPLEEYRNNVRAHRDVMRRAKTHLKLILTREFKGKEDFLMYASSKRKTKKNVGQLLSEVITRDAEKSALLQSLLLRQLVRNSSPWS